MHAVSLDSTIFSAHAYDEHILEGSSSFIPHSLYQKIDIDRVLCWNEAEEGSGKTVFKAWEDRMDRDKTVESDVDPELLFHIPFVHLSPFLFPMIVAYYTSISYPCLFLCLLKYSGTSE